MGLHPSKDAHSQEFDNGSLISTGIYPASIHDYDYPTVRQLILQRRLAPFYQGQQDIDFTSQSDPSSVDNTMPTQSPPSNDTQITHTSINTRNILPTISKYRPHRKSSLPQTLSRYENAVECPICFLYYPPNINYSRCCHQPICSECFVHIRQPTEPSEMSASCPFCVEPNFGITYQPPSWAPITDIDQNQRAVTVDLIRPYHTRNLPSRHHRHTVTGSANGSTRRIIVRPSQTSMDSNQLSSAARDYRDYLTAVRQMNMDLEELMVMEAIRLSLLEQEQQDDTPQSSSDSSTVTSQSQEHALEL